MKVADQTGQNAGKETHGALPKPARQSLLALLPRVALCAALILLGVYTLSIYRRLFAPPRPTQAAPVAAATVSLPEVLLADVVNGGWVIENSRWSLQAKTLHPGEVATWFKTRPDIPPQTQGDTELGAKILQAVPTSARRESHGDCVDYVWDQRGFRARVSFLDREPPGLVAAQIAVNRGNEPGIALQAVFVDDTLPKGPRKDVAGVWPLPEDAIEVAIRTDAGGAVLARLVHSNVAPEALPALWRNSGWQVSATEGATSVGDHWNCERDGESFVVWCFRESLEMPSLLFLLRLQSG